MMTTKHQHLVSCCSNGLPKSCLFTFFFFLLANRAGATFRNNRNNQLMNIYLRQTNYHFFKEVNFIPIGYSLQKKKSSQYEIGLFKKVAILAVCYFHSYTVAQCVFCRVVHIIGKALIGVLWAAQLRAQLQLPLLLYCALQYLFSSFFLQQLVLFFWSEAEVGPEKSQPQLASSPILILLLAKQKTCNNNR